MKKIELIKTYVEGDTIRYQVREEKGLGLLQQEIVDLFIRYHGDEHYDLNKCPQSILQLPISLYLLPITYFYNVELVIPEMDKTLFDQLPAIYDAYSKIYGPFKAEWKGKVTVGKIVENIPVSDAKYDKVVFFSGGVDACHAGINNPGKRSLLVSIPDIEYLAKNDGPLREEKFALIKAFSKIVDSDWLLISNNFNASLFRVKEIMKYLHLEKGLNSQAYKFDGWPGIIYLANMCSVAPVAYLEGVSSFVMGSGFEQLEDDKHDNLDGANPKLVESIEFATIKFAKPDGIATRRSKKVRNIINWCKLHSVKTKLWACFCDDSVQCGFCRKCVRTQMNILCAGENPTEWGFEKFNEKAYTEYIKSYSYIDGDIGFLWDNIETIDSNKIYPYCNDLLHWLKSIGYKEYHRRATEKAKPTIAKRLLAFSQYPHYVKTIFSKFLGK